MTDQRHRIDAPLRRLAMVAPVAAASARAALDTVLARIVASTWPEVAWTASGLTDDGFPVEFAWSSGDVAVRWTAEVAGPETPEADRLAIAAGLVDRLAPGGRSAIEQAVAGAPLHFGAWLGGRHNGAETRYKLYVERPRIDPADASVLDSLEIALSRRIEWRLLGQVGHGGSVEYYGRFARPGLPDLRRGLEWAGIAGFAGLATAVGALNPAEAPFGRHGGISVTLASDTPTALCWFALPHAIARTTAGVAAAVFAATKVCGGDPMLLTALLGDPCDPLGRIGMTGIGSMQGGSTWVQAGWRPEAGQFTT